MDHDSDLGELLQEAFSAAWSHRREGTPEERLRNCLARRDSGCRSRILRDVQHHLERGLCDMQMSELIAFELGCHLRPAEMGLTASEWLRWVGRQVAREERLTPSQSSARDDLA